MFSSSFFLEGGGWSLESTRCDFCLGCFGVVLLMFLFWGLIFAYTFGLSRPS